MANEYRNNKFIVSVDDGGVITARSLAEPVLRQTRSTPDGGIVVTDITLENAGVDDRALLLAKKRASLFYATYAEPGWWNCDIDCGMQRWHGLKPTKDLSLALANCELDKEEIKSVLKKAKKHPQAYCPRSW